MGSLGKIILIMLLGVAIWLLIRPRPTRTAASQAEPAESLRDAGESVVACAQCGLHVPESEAVFQNGRSYCCAAHARGA